MKLSPSTCYACEAFVQAKLSSADQYDPNVSWVVIGSDNISVGHCVALAASSVAEQATYGITHRHENGGGARSRINTMYVGYQNTVTNSIPTTPGTRIHARWPRSRSRRNLNQLVNSSRAQRSNFSVPRTRPPYLPLRPFDFSPFFSSLDVFSVINFCSWLSDHTTHTYTHLLIHSFTYRHTFLRLVHSSILKRLLKSRQKKVEV
ncbi:hypothetical protein MPTK1_7g08360 [Marchantia polymorpha subsp. ruderalis]|uniref:Uncharacterized protein n=2 Tax=Marchantia polymorpha TaxID=3197 RepID=A0AAF6BXD9_MARPO|nr:hypothetical protein MARPO_0146s0036 [Marchantia polymorpha]BBN16673.1 hypothetical protein Mp_7g08360 [Marchantia polymorpha subsp. ruderalis]|eukprot:PTQ29220.1 hypothetical protein MARPO_0146s0036 [Marchantia polymorpha]